MKLEIRTVSLTIDPGFVVEGNTEEEIKEALIKVFNHDILSCQSLWVDGIGYVKAADDAPSVRAEDIEDDEDGAAEVIDRTVAESERYAEFMSKQGALFAEEEAA